MNLETIGKRLSKIIEYGITKGDDEYAHVDEDALFVDVLQAIADGKCEDDPADCARLALKSKEIKFARWCA